MRKLQTKDIFSVLRLIQKSNLKEELKPMIAMAAAGEMKVEDIGLEGVLTMIEIFSAAKSESAIYEFLAGPFELESEQVKEMDLCTLAENLERLSKENDLKHFFTILQGLITRS